VVLFLGSHDFDDFDTYNANIGTFLLLITVVRCFFFDFDVIFSMIYDRHSSSVENGRKTIICK